MKKQMTQNLEKEYQKLTHTLRDRKSDDLRLISDAWEFAKLAHGTHMRKNGDLYILHPLKTAQFLAAWNLDTVSVAAGLLHDTVEDGGATRADLVQNFGSSVATLVDGVTTVSSIRLKGSHDDIFTESLRKMILVMARDLRVVFVKLADRMHNMQTLDALPSEKQQKISRETLEIFAPLAERLGMGSVKAQLEDLAFMYLYPNEYKKLLEVSNTYYTRATEHTKKMTQSITNALKKEGIHAEVFGRQKHLFSLWKKLEREEIAGDFDKIHDVVALRVLVDKIVDCYAALGLVHAQYRPAPKIGISDFIAQPKPNGYRSIHTKVFGPEGRVVEVQIRTYQMHEEAEHGAAAHWAYSEAKAAGAGDKALESGVATKGANRLSWVKELVSWQNQMSDSDEFLKAVKFDGFQHRNFVFSPQGDVYDLPRNATPVDFAFAVHTSLGFYIQGAKVNDKIVPLSYKLKSGDIVEILKSKNKHEPSRHWLEFVVTTTARRNIQKRFK